MVPKLRASNAPSFIQIQGRGQVSGSHCAQEDEHIPIVRVPHLLSFHSP
jgi:hypothetical protein